MSAPIRADLDLLEHSHVTQPPVSVPAESIGAKPIAIAAYQDLVSHRYSDKLPGTTYNDQGMAGGYDTTAATQPAAAQSAAAASTAASARGYVLPITAASGAIVLALLVVVRRKMTYND